MKMLGQDLHTQEEFDAFHQNEFQPLRDLVKKTASQAKSALFLSVFALVVAIGSAVFVVASSMPK